jgi:hypothetical protein
MRNYVYKDLTNQVFGDWTVIKRAEDADGSIMWLCKCSCGVERDVWGADLKRGGSTGCGCHKSRGLAGRIYGRLKVLDYAGVAKNRHNIWKCQCICGTDVFVTSDSLISGHTKSCGCLNMENLTRSGENHRSWKGGRRKRAKGYVAILKPDHPNADEQGYVLEHVFVMSEHIGRPLKKKETVHHKNGIRDYNLIDNLELWVSNHPSGQRVSDLLHWAKKFIADYESIGDKL